MKSSKKVKVKFDGGPFSGKTAVISNTASETLTFSVKSWSNLPGKYVKTGTLARNSSSVYMFVWVLVTS